MRKRICLLGCFAVWTMISLFLFVQMSGHKDPMEVKATEIPKEVTKSEAKELDKEKPKEPEVNQKPMVALTFDDGPNAQYTPLLLDILKKYDAKATFFMLGNNVEANPALVKKVAKEGHEIGNHSYSHADLMTLNTAGRQEEINRTQELIRAQSGTYPRWLRPPYGSADLTILEKETDMDVAFWDVDTRDWESRNTASVVQVFKENAKEGSIVLFHDLYGTSVDAVEQILKEYASQYQFVTISTLVDAQNAKK